MGNSVRPGIGHQADQGASSVGIRHSDECKKKKSSKTKYSIAVLKDLMGHVVSCEAKQSCSEVFGIHNLDSFGKEANSEAVVRKLLRSKTQ